jgi:hypothetical protein
MVAPLDSRATLVAGDEKIDLVMNFRTIALAETERPDAIAGGGGTLSGMAVLVWAFAQPAHPDLTLDQAAALCLEHGPAVGAALAQVIARGGAKGDGTARPRKAGQSKS